VPSGGVDRRRTELSVERGDLANQSGNVEGGLDKMERQADLMQQARLKYGEADMAEDDIPTCPTRRRSRTPPHPPRRPATRTCSA
jgi:hypothetical protein